MQLTSVPSRRVVWEDGMHLTPQHFQAQRRYQEDQTTCTLELLFPFAYGLSALAIDEEALGNGSLALVLIRGVLPDGTVVHAPGADLLPAAIALNGRFSPTRDSHVVHLAIPRWRSNEPNVSGDAGAGSSAGTTTSGGRGEAEEISTSGAPPTRYHAIEERVVDEATGADPLPVRFAARNLYVLLDEEVEPDVISLPVARVRRDGRGQFQLDADYIPPTLQLGASGRLLNLLSGLVALLEAKGGALSVTLQNAPAGAAGGSAAYVGNELATRWLLHAVRTADAPLRHLLLTRSAHPEQLYLELSRLAGALCTFSLASSPRTLPMYDHDDLTSCFNALEIQIRSHLDTVISARAIVVPLQRTADVLHTAAVSDLRCYEPGARWFLGFRAALSHADLVDGVQRLTKTCASVYVLELVNRAWNGFPIEHIPAPPAAIAPKPDLAYFELTMTGGCAVSLANTREIGVYVPEALPGTYVEAVVLVPA